MGIIAVYTTIVVSFLHRAFALIHHVPDKVLRWISGGPQDQLGAEFSHEILQSAHGAAHGGASTVGRGAAQGGSMRPSVWPEEEKLVLP